MATPGLDESTPIETYVILKVETTAPPWQAGIVRTKIVELCCIALPRTVLEEDTDANALSNLEKFYVKINPKRRMGEGAELNNPTFLELFDSFKEFLENLPKPVCLVAHNGNSYDFKMLRFECNEIKRDQKVLPEDLLTADSLRAFQSFMKDLPEKKEYNLPALYRRFIGEDKQSNRADENAQMLVQIIAQNRAFFMQWANENFKHLSGIKAFYENVQRVQN